MSPTSMHTRTASRLMRSALLLRPTASLTITASKPSLFTRTPATAPTSTPTRHASHLARLIGDRDLIALEDAAEEEDRRRREHYRTMRAMPSMRPEFRPLPTPPTPTGMYMYTQGVVTGVPLGLGLTLSVFGDAWWALCWPVVSV